MRRTVRGSRTARTFSRPWTAWWPVGTTCATSWGRPSSVPPSSAGTSRSKATRASRYRDAYGRHCGVCKPAASVGMLLLINGRLMRTKPLCGSAAVQVRLPQDHQEQQGGQPIAVYVLAASELSLFQPRLVELYWCDAHALALSCLFPLRTSSTRAWTKSSCCSCSRRAATRTSSTSCACMTTSTTR